MGNKFKPRQMRRPRNKIVQDMIVQSKAEVFRDRRDRRAKEREDVRYFLEDDEDEDECEF